MESDGEFVLDSKRIEHILKGNNIISYCEIAINDVLWRATYSIRQAKV